MVNTSGSGNQSLEHHGNPSGRPPENITDLGVLPILERPTSPLDLEEQQLAKKSKGDGTRVDFGDLPNDATYMETDVIHSEGPGEPQSDNSNLRGKETYASMAAKGHPVNGNQVPENGFDSDEVVVLDEDCTVDESGRYPMIRFSDRAHDRVDWSMRHTIIVRLLRRSIGYKEVPRPEMPAPVQNSTSDGSNISLYGPWMIATTRRRRAPKATNPATSNEAEHNHPRGSRFAALHIEEVVEAVAGRTGQEPGVPLPIIEEVAHGKHRIGARSDVVVPRQAITKNAAYLASNPDRKSKKVVVAKDVTRELNVVLLVAKHPASVVPHTVQRGSKWVKVMGRGLKYLGKFSGKGFKLHRQTEPKSTGNRAPSLWAKEFADQIDVLAANEHFQPTISVNRDRLENDMDYSSDDGGEFVDSSLEKSNDGAVVPTQGF
ncbi:hypothetical protein V6N11_022346 [Hibiscus sabdariffa]|uniref:Uncharacterized protein n=1 Tax=Hibiscus sabdariffa TaxID=183260 RepID=A0ABR2TIX1_9ROSI